MVSARGVETDPDKIRALLDWPVLQTEKELRSFLGLCSYYRQFIDGFARVTAPLNALLKGPMKAKSRKTSRSITAEWTDECNQAFNQLKMLLTTAPVLGHPDFNKPFVVETDSSHRGLGAVLAQDQDGKRVVLSYASRGLKGSERNMDNYSSRKLEVGTVGPEMGSYRKVQGHFDWFEHPLCYLQTSAKLNATELRWAAELASFNFDIKYKPGRNNTVADALSRKKAHSPGPAGGVEG